MVGDHQEAVIQIAKKLGEPLILDSLLKTEAQGGGARAAFEVSRYLQNMNNPIQGLTDEFLTGEPSMLEKRCDTLSPHV